MCSLGSRRQAGAIETGHRTVTQQLTDEGRRIIEDAASRHGVSPEAARTMLFALVAGQGSQAQFNIPELGGMGQWSRGGMTMVGDMFNTGLKARVDALCSDLSGLIGGGSVFASPSQSQSQSGGAAGGSGVSLFVAGSGASGNWWPGDLGPASSTGAQNDLRYAVFPGARRVAIEHGGKVTIYDTGDHGIGGVSQQQSGDRTLTFTSQHGTVRLSDLPVVGDPAPEFGQGRQEPEPRAPEKAAAEMPAPAQQGEPAPGGAPAAAAQPAPSARSGDDVFALLERLSDLRRKDIISEAEFEAKKAELLSRI